MKPQHIKAFAVTCLLISLATWGMDALSIVAPCSYCRVQRTVIGLLGLVLLLPYARCIWLRYGGNVVALFGAVVAAMQHFNGWNDLSKGAFNFSTPLYADSFVLSGFALVIIVAQAMLLNHTREYEQ
ncbi:MAG: hypothetical protein ACD_10C00383G0002 [uncultured bacterium]|nr:MAG: hypothetical protein ACD_10C00383G0002 [uncultured bacterium]